VNRVGRVAGLVLAAGASLRHPDPFKLLLPFGPETIVGSSVRAALAAGLDPLVVVLGHRAAEVQQAVDAEDALFVENPRYAEGVGTSLAAGVRRLVEDETVEGLAILLADEPGVSPAVIGSVVEAWRRSAAALLRAVYRDRPGHPILVHRSVFGLLERAEGDEGLAGVLRKEGLRFHPVHVDLSAPVDIDTPEDYARVVSGRVR
jgi:molybdenum cofactor cytidylyltransferase